MERISGQMHQYNLEKEAVVVGDGVLEAAGIRPTITTDAVVDAKTFATLRQTNGWQPVEDQPDMLVRDTVRVRVADTDYQSLADQAHHIDGAQFESLANVYAAKQEATHSRDVDDMEAIRARLYDRPLPLAFLDSELAFVQGLVPETVQHNPAVAVAANGLYIVRTLFGHAKSTANDEVRSYSGKVERFPVLSTFHEYDHTANGMRRLPEHARLANDRARSLGKLAVYTTNDLLAMVTAYAYHDSHMGHGRMASNPESFDELRSAKTVRRHLQLAGATDDNMPEKAYAGVLATTFNQTTRQQDVDPTRGHLNIQIGVAGTDLGEFAEPIALNNFFKVAIEDGFRVIFDRPFGAKADELGIMPRSIWEALAIIDTDQELKQLLATSIKKSCQFCMNHKFPEGWMLDSFTQRVENAYLGMKLAEAIEANHISTTEAARIAFSDAPAAQISSMLIELAYA